MITHVEDIMPIKLRSQARQTPCRKNSRTMKTAMAVSCWGGQFWEGDGESILEDKWTEYHWAVSWKWLRWKILCYGVLPPKKIIFFFIKREEQLEHRSSATVLALCCRAKGSMECVLHIFTSPSQFPSFPSADCSLPVLPARAHTPCNPLLRKQQVCGYHWGPGWPSQRGKESTLCGCSICLP